MSLSFNPSSHEKDVKFELGAVQRSGGVSMTNATKVTYSAVGKDRYQFEYGGTDNPSVKIGMLLNLQARLKEEMQFLGADAARIANEVLDEMRRKRELP
jgi:hypothetical protein